MPKGKKSNAQYCCDSCRVKAWRERNHIPSPIRNDTVVMTKSYTCCEAGRFYSPVGAWGKILICDTCGAEWYRK